MWSVLPVFWPTLMANRRYVMLIQHSHVIFSVFFNKGIYEVNQPIYELIVMNIKWYTPTIFFLNQSINIFQQHFYKVQ